MNTQNNNTLDAAIGDSPGYVYILVNASMPGLIKIGRTFREPRERARELTTTGVPTPFQVAFEVFSERHELLETSAHAELMDFRVSTSREFFRFPLDKAIVLLLRLNSPPIHATSQYVAEDITESLQAKYARWMRTDITAVRIVQVPGRVWLEVTEEEELGGYLRNQTIRRTDLAFIHGERDCMLFNPTDDVRENARKFVEDFGLYSTYYVTDLFGDRVIEEIELLHNPHYKSGTK